MKITIDEKICHKHKLSVLEVLMSLFVRQGGDTVDVLNNLINREVLVRQNGKLFITQRWNDEIDEIICDSSGGVNNEERLVNLASKMIECYPEGKMKDRFGRVTPYYYRCNKPEVVRKLKKFFLQFGDFPDDAIIDATKRYVAANSRSNNSNLRLIKYFILKDAIKEGEDGNGHVEQVSDLLTFLENKEEGAEVTETASSEDWMTTLRN